MDRRLLSPPVMIHRILLADDNDLFRELVATRLASAGYDIREAIDGEEALEWLSVSKELGLAPPEVIVLDVEMPRRSGIDVLVELRRAGRTTPVVLLTALVKPELRATAAQWNATILEKPFTLETLEAKLRAAVA